MAQSNQTFRALISLGFGLGLLIILSACSSPNAIIGPNGTLNVLNVGPNFNVDELPGDWFLAGNARPPQIIPASNNPYNEIRVTSGPEAFALTRRTKASLLTTPYLSWRWKPKAGVWKHHPVRILIGFNNGANKPARRQGLARVFPGLSLPPHDRGLSIVWGPSALMRGTLIHLSGTKGNRKEVYYTIRGGQENTDIWWKEAIDLSHLYAKSWPEDDVSRSRIVFIGIGAAKSSGPEISDIADIRLSR